MGIGDPSRQPLLSAEDATPSAPPCDDCSAIDYNPKERQKAGASSLPDSRPPPIHTHPKEPIAHNELPQRYADDGQQRIMEGAETRVIVVRQGGLSPLVICPWCHRQGPTIQYKKNGFCTWFAAFLTCATGCWPLCPFTFCVEAFKDTVHYCSHCRRYLGRTLA